MKFLGISFIALAGCAASAQDSASLNSDTNISPAAQMWNVHVINTDTTQWHPAFPARYSGPNSLNSQAASSETVDLDVMARPPFVAGSRVQHVDGLAWQGFGLSRTLGIEAFPNAMAYKVGARLADGTFSRVFIRQTIGLGGVAEDVPDDGLHLAGKQDESRLVVTLGEISVLDIFDNNAYAGDPTKQFLNWAFVGNEAWDYPCQQPRFHHGRCR